MSQSKGFVVYGLPLSPFVRKVEAALGEKKLAYSREDVNVLNLPSWFAEISPARRIPVLRDLSVGESGVAGTIPDSSVICAYLERVHPEPALYPREPVAYARALWLEEYCDSELVRCGAQVFRPLLFPRFQKREPTAEEVALATKTWRESLPPLLDYLERALDGREHFVGEHFGIADIAFATTLFQVTLVAGPINATRWPDLTAHAQRAEARESMRANAATCRAIVKEPRDLGAQA